jgi:hypothetical protein
MSGGAAERYSTQTEPQTWPNAIRYSPIVVLLFAVSSSHSRQPIAQQSFDQRFIRDSRSLRKCA